MTRQLIRRWVLGLLRELKIPFNDPCNPNYEYDCLCGGSVTTTIEEPSFTSGDNEVTLSSTPSSLGNIQVYIGGQKVPNSKLSLTGNTLTFTSQVLIEGDEVEIIYS